MHRKTKKKRGEEEEEERSCFFSVVREESKCMKLIVDVFAVVVVFVHFIYFCRRFFYLLSKAHSPRRESDRACDQQRARAKEQDSGTEWEWMSVKSLPSKKVFVEFIITHTHWRSQDIRVIAELNSSANFIWRLFKVVRVLLLLFD